MWKVREHSLYQLSLTTTCLSPQSQWCLVKEVSSFFFLPGAVMTWHAMTFGFSSRVPELNSQLSSPNLPCQKVLEIPLISSNLNIPLAHLSVHSLSEIHWQMHNPLAQAGYTSYSSIHTSPSAPSSKLVGCLLQIIVCSQTCACLVIRMGTVLGRKIPPPDVHIQIFKVCRCVILYGSRDLESMA